MRITDLIPDWRHLQLETLRVLKPGSSLFHEWGNGGSNDDLIQIREQARSLFEAAGFEIHFIQACESRRRSMHFLRIAARVPSRRFRVSRMNMSLCVSSCLTA